MREYRFAITCDKASSDRKTLIVSMPDKRLLPIPMWFPDDVEDGYYYQKARRVAVMKCQQVWGPGELVEAGPDAFRWLLLPE